MTVQLRNAELVDLLWADFIHRNEPNFAWNVAVSSVLALPNLRAFWPGSAVGYQATDQDRDIGGGGHHLTSNGTTTYGYTQLVPYVEFDGNSDFTERADGGAGNWADITGTAAWVPTAQQGLSIGGWFLFDALGNGEMVMSKYGAAGHRSYRLGKTAGNLAQFSVSNDLTAVTNVPSVAAVAAATWYFIAGVFDNTGNVIKVWLNNVSASVAFVNTVADSDAAFRCGVQADGSYYHDGKQSLRWLCGCALSDSIVLQLWAWQRSLFGYAGT